MKRTTVRAIYRAIRNYPRSAGASVRNIHRILTKNEKGKSRRSLSSVKLAIARAVKNGSIRAPKGWPGFRGIDSSRNQRGQSVRRRGRPPMSRGRSKSSMRRGSRARKARSLSKRSRRARSLSKRNSRRGRARSVGKRGARSRGRQVRSVRFRYKKRGRSCRRPRRVVVSNSNNSSRANISDNYNSAENSEGETTSIWKTYPCIIS